MMPFWNNFQLCDSMLKCLKKCSRVVTHLLWDLDLEGKSYSGKNQIKFFMYTITWILMQSMDHGSPSYLDPICTFFIQQFNDNYFQDWTIHNQCRIQPQDIGFCLLRGIT